MAGVLATVHSLCCNAPKIGGMFLLNDGEMTE
ncbi:hypothetical protein rosmuc_01325 [Roseovarius mucosus DSM 17069]|uniref:Uncharacterized protein n=1 Tax=Roseovarius mucosus DSM 17069 TaxID=1288298 RepID=A0A0A0HPH5_9RHOB|nr:hypothetical protein rosmuc_01325 [Roseovarius mucosus DSM 17069]